MARDFGPLPSARLLRLSLAVRALSEQSEWLYVTDEGLAENGWDTGTFNSDEFLGFFRDGYGFVHFRGDAQQPNELTEDNRRIFTLPGNYRPSHAMVFPLPVDDYNALGEARGGTAAGYYLQVNTDGGVIFQGAATGFSNYSLTTDGIRFRAA